MYGKASRNKTREITCCEGHKGENPVSRDSSPFPLECAHPCAPPPTTLTSCPTTVRHPFTLRRQQGGCMRKGSTATPHGAPRQPHLFFVAAALLLRYPPCGRSSRPLPARDYCGVRHMPLQQPMHMHPPSAHGMPLTLSHVLRRARGVLEGRARNPPFAHDSCTTFLPPFLVAPLHESPS